MASRESVSYRVEFLNAADISGPLNHMGNKSQTKSYIRLDSDGEVIQLIRNTFHRLSR